MVTITPIVIGVIKLLGKQNKFTRAMFHSLVEGKKREMSTRRWCTLLLFLLLYLVLYICFRHTYVSRKTCVCVLGLTISYVAYNMRMTGPIHVFVLSVAHMIC
jgi:hypothetical protein